MILFLLLVAARRARAGPMLCDWASATISTVAGSGFRADADPAMYSRPGASFADGVGTNAQFSAPSGLALPPAASPLYQGALLVADTDNSLVRQIVLATGAVTTLAGRAGTNDFADGRGTNAKFALPQGLAVAPNGLLYIADSDNHLLRVMAADGTVTTFAGQYGNPSTTPCPCAGNDGAGTNALFNFPTGLLIVGGTDMYVADTNGNQMRCVTLATAAVITLAGIGNGASGAAGVGTNADFYKPRSPTLLPSGAIAFANFYSYQIMAVTPGTAGVAQTGAVTVVAGTGAPPTAYWQSSPGAAAAFGTLSGVAAASSGDLYVTEVATQRVRSVTPAGFVDTFAGSGSELPFANGAVRFCSFSSPYAIVFDEVAGVLYTADAGNATVRRIACASASPSPTASATASGPPTGTPSRSGSPTPPATPSGTASTGLSPSGSPTAPGTPPATPSASQTPSVSPTASLTPSVTPTASQTATNTASGSDTPSETASITASSTATPTPSLSLGASPSLTPSPTATLSVTRTSTRSGTPTLSPLLDGGAGAAAGAGGAAAGALTDAGAAAVVLGVALLVSCALLAAALRVRAARLAAAKRRAAATAAPWPAVPPPPPPPPPPPAAEQPTENPMRLAETHDPHSALAEATRVFVAASEELKRRQELARALSAGASNASARWLAAARGDTVIVGGVVHFTDGPGGARLAQGWRRVGDANVLAAPGAPAAYEHVDGRRVAAPPLADAPAADGAGASAAPPARAGAAPDAPPDAVRRAIIAPLKDYELVRGELFFLDGPGGARLQRGWRRVTDGVDVWYAHRDHSETVWVAPLAAV